MARLVYLSVHGCAPEYLECEQMVSKKSLRNGANGAVLLCVETATNVSEQGRWEVTAAKLWNALPAELIVVGMQNMGIIV